MFMLPLKNLARKGLKLDNQVVNSTYPKDKLGWIWRADDP